MITKILGIVAGAKVAERSGSMGSAGGALLGFAVSALIRRMSIASIAAIAVGGYVASKIGSRNSDGDPLNDDAVRDVNEDRR